MALHLIFGEAGTGKSEYCISLMKELHSRGTPSMMIVPEQFAHTAELRLIEENGFLSDEIQSISFRRLAFKTLKKSGKTKKTISKIGKSMLLSKAILKLSDSLTLYQNTAAKPGFIDSMLSFISECKRSGIDPDRLMAFQGTESPYFAMKLSELASIYQVYQNYLNEDFTDSEDYLPLLADVMEQEKSFSGYHIFIDEFFRFTPAEVDCIRGFLLSGAEVYVTLCAKGPEAGGVFAPVTQTATLLSRMAKEIGISCDAPILLTEKYRFQNSPELSFFEENYSRYASHLYYKEETQDIALYIAPDLYTETQVLAANIRKAIVEKGLRYRDIAIIAGNPEIYTDLIKTVFPQYDIPVFIDQKHSLLTHPIIIMLLSVLSLMSRGLETETLLNYIKTGYSGISRDEADILENFALAGRLNQGDWLDDKRFLKRADSVFYQTEDLEEQDAGEAEKLLDIRNRVLAPLLTLRQELKEDRQVQHRAEAFFHFFEAISLYDTVQEEIELLKTLGEHQVAQEYGEIYNLLMNLLDELVSALGQEKIGLSRLETILTAGLSQCEISTIPPVSDQVFFGDTGRSLVKNVKALFVIGATSDAFPSAPPQEGLIKDAERALLEKQGLSLGPDGKKIAFQNQFLVYSALAISAGTMQISYPVADLEGKGMLPSPLIGRLRTLFPKLNEISNLIVPPKAEQLIAGKKSAWQYTLEHFTEESNLEKALKEAFRNDPEYQDAYHAMECYSQYTHKVKDLSPALAKSLYGRNLRSSVTRLEKFSSCPFSYFIRYGLKAKERKILKIDAPDIGHLIHEIVELASRRMVKEHLDFGTMSQENIRHIAEETVDELMASLFIRHLYSENRLGALIQRLKIQVTKMLTMICAHVAQGDFEPCAFEVEFSEDGSLPPVTVKLPTGESITLIGRIDRIDVLKKDADVYIKIIDYKTGNKSFSLSDMYHKLSLQLAVYVTAACQDDGKLFDGKVKPAGMFYFRLADQTIDVSKLSAENALMKQFKMSGLVLQDADIVRAMDKGIHGHSAIIPAYAKQDGSLSEKMGSYATLSQFEKLSGHIKNTVKKLGAEILKGSAQISPCKTEGGFPCRYCEFHSICAFDKGTDPYRVAKPFPDDDIWKMIENE